MKKIGFNTPTISSVSKLNQDPVSLREKVQKLSSVVSELKNNAVQEDSYLQNLQQSNMKNYNQLNQQLQTLKKSFTSLSDILLNEITNLGDHFGQAVNHLNQKVDYINNYVNGQTQFTEQITNNYSELEQELQNIVKSGTNREGQMDLLNQQISSLQALFEKEKDDSKLMLEKIKAILANNQNQIDLVSKDKSSQSQQIIDLKSRVQQLLNGLNQQEKRSIDQEEASKLTNLEIQTKINELKTLNFTHKESQRNEISNQIRELSSHVKNIEDRVRSSDETLEQLQRYQMQKTLEFDQKLKQQSQDIQQDLEELAQIYKDSSAQIITDFDKVVNNQHNELRYMVKKVEVLENKQLQMNEEFQIKLRWKDK